MDELHIKNFKNFIVETKKSEDLFAPFDPHKITLKINLWRENIVSLEEKDLNPEKYVILIKLRYFQIILKII